jgi:tetratricopeptide (TPR) repeat protein
VLIENRKDAGCWDEALRLANTFIAECEAGRPHYGESWARIARAGIGLARGQREAVMDDVEKALVVARDAKDPQNLCATLGFAIRAYAELGRRDEARALAEELLAAGRTVATESLDFILVSSEFGVADHVVDLLREASAAKRWEMAALTFLQERIAEGALIFEELGVTSFSSKAAVPMQAQSSRRLSPSTTPSTPPATSAKSRSCSTRANWPRSNSTCRKSRASRAVERAFLRRRSRPGT